jgi:hypothetical protein
VSDRGFSATIEAALDDERVDLALAVYLNWPGGAVRTWSGLGSKTWNAQTWTGVGELGSISQIADGLEKTDTGVEITLNYLDDTLRNEVNTNDPTGEDASIYLWLMNVTTGAVTDGYELFSGYIDRVEIEDDGSTGRIIVRLASELARLSQSTFYTLSDAHQQLLFSGDVGMEFAARMDEPILWGRGQTTFRRPDPRPRINTPDDPFSPPAEPGDYYNPNYVPGEAQR